MKSIIKKDNIKNLKEASELCNCDCDLKIIKALSCEKEYKFDYSSKFKILNDEINTIGAYCSECKSLYEIKMKYESTYKTDNMELIYINKKSYFELMNDLKELENKFTKENHHVITLDDYIIRVLSFTKNENYIEKIISYYNLRYDTESIEHIECCYNCDNKIILVDESKVDCLIHNKKFKYNNICDKFEND